MSNPDSLCWLQQLWTAAFPSKIHIFEWQLLTDRLPIMDALMYRGIIAHALAGSCIFFRNFEENINHLFFQCFISYSVWLAILKCLGLEGTLHDLEVACFTQFGGFFRDKNSRMVQHYIWLSVVSSIWQ